MRSASFPVDGSTFEGLRDAVETRLDRLKNSLFYRTDMEGLSFWDIVTRLLGETGSYNFV